MAGEFLADVEAIRKRAREHMSQGAVIQSYQGDIHKAIEMLNIALATEIVCVLRYRHHYYMASGLHGESAAKEFLEHANNEQEHADKLAVRIKQLGGAPKLNPEGLLTRSVSQYVEGESLADMIQEDLVAERAVIEVYGEMIRYFGFHDNTTRELLEELLKDEEGHADDMADLLYLVNPRTGEAEGVDPSTRSTERYSDGSTLPSPKDIEKGKSQDRKKVA